MDKYKTITTVATTTAIIALLAGCSSSGSGSGSSGHSAIKTAYAEEETDTLQAFVNTEDGFALESKANTLAFQDGSTSSDLTNVTFESTDEGDVKISAYGQSTIFTSEHLQSDGSYKNDDAWIDTAFGGTISQYQTGDTAYKYMMPLKGGDADGDNRFYAIVGLQTPEAELTGKANATYNGKYRADAYPTSDPSHDSRVRVGGNVELNADFEAGTISGSLIADDLYAGSDGYETVATNIVETNIVGNGFSTTLEATSDQSIELTGGTFEGTFYGNTAQEAGGTMTLEGQNEGGTNYGAAGVWVASESTTTPTQ